MSTRAHKVIEVRTDKDTSFSTSDEHNFLDACNIDTLDSDCCGLCMANIKKLEEILEAMPDNIRDEHIKLREDIAVAKKNGETEIEYFLY